MSRSLYPWLEPAFNLLCSYRNQNRLPGGLCVSAPTDLGQKRLIDVFAQLCFCTQPVEAHQPCGVCAACRLSIADNYPDYLVLSVEEGSSVIKVDAIRSLCADLALNPQFNQHRFAVIVNADQLNRSAANALLKTLEEPSPQTTIVLLTEHVNRLPATLRSRCQPMVLSADVQLMTDWLHRNGCTESEAYLRLANGSPLRARVLWKDKALAVRNKLLDALYHLVMKDADPIRVAEQFQPNYPLPALDWISGWVMDLIRLQSVNDATVLQHADQIQRLQDLATILEFKLLFQLLDKIHTAKQRASSTLNKQLEFEDLLISWQQCKTKTSNKRIVHV